MGKTKPKKPINNLNEAKALVDSIFHGDNIFYGQSSALGHALAVQHKHIKILLVEMRKRMMYTNEK